MTSNLWPIVFIHILVCFILEDCSYVANTFYNNPTSIFHPHVPKILTPKDCHKVSQEMSIKGIEIHQPDSLPLPAHGEMKCRESRLLTCCTKKMEEQLFEESRNQFIRAYQEKFNLHLNILNETYNFLEKNFTEIITRSYESMNATLTLSLNHLYSRNPLMTKNLFHAMLNYLTDPTSSLMNISQRVEIFADNIFSRLACHLLFQQQSMYSTTNCGSVSDCVVKQVLRKSLPISSLASAITKKIIDSIRVARAVVNGVRVLTYVLDVMKSDNFDAECHTELLRMQLCSLCAGVPVIQACRPLCLRTVHRCQANFVLVVNKWKKFIPQLARSLDRLGELDSFDYQLAMFPEQIRSLLSLYDKEQPLLHNNMLHQCPHVGRSYVSHNRFSSLLPPDKDHRVVTKVVMPTREFRSTIAVLKSQMMQLQSFFSNLTSFICNKPEMSASLSVITNCWNGSAVAKYSEEIYYQESPRNNYYTDPLNAALIKTLTDITRSIATTLQHGKAYQWIMPEENFYFYKSKLKKKKKKNRSRKDNSKTYNSENTFSTLHKRIQQPKTYQPERSNSKSDSYMMEIGSSDDILNSFNIPKVFLGSKPPDNDGSGFPTKNKGIIQSLNLPEDDEDKSDDSGSGSLPPPNGEYKNYQFYTTNRKKFNDGTFSTDLDKKNKNKEKSNIDVASNHWEDNRPIAKQSTGNNISNTLRPSHLATIASTLCVFKYYRSLIG